MLLLVFEAGNNRYGIEASEIIEVVPVVAFTKVPHAPAYVAGLFNYRGTVVPVIDLQALLGENPARRLISTRIMVVRFPSAAGPDRELGLLAERITETRRCGAEDFQPAGIQPQGAKYLGSVLADAGSFVQKVTVSEILTEDVKRILFEDTGKNA